MSADVLVKAARFPSFQATDGPEVPFRPPVVAKANEAELARETARRDGLALGEAEGRAAALADWVPRLTALAAALEAWRAEDEHAATLPSVVIRVDEGLHRGDWIIETEGGLLDGRLVTKFEEAARILTEPEA